MAEPHEIERLLPRHYKILELALAGNGPKEIAQALEMSREAIGLIMRAPIFQEAFAKSRSKVESAQVETQAVDAQRARTVLENASVRAAEVQASLLESKKETVQLAASEAVLDRVLGKSAPTVQGSLVINTETVQLLQVAIAESFGGTRLKQLESVDA